MAIATSDPPLKDPAAQPAHRSKRRHVKARRMLSQRLTTSMFIGVVAALLTFALAMSLLADRREMRTVAVARERIAAGAVITPEMVASEQVPAATGFADSLVDFDRVAGGSLIAARTVQPGEPLTGSAVGGSSSASGHRVMSIPLATWQAANGDLQVGDQVDVIAVTTTGARYVLTAAPVVGRSAAASGGGLVGGVRSGDLVISVEVDADQALQLAAAIESGKVTVVRSTGATPVPAPAPASASAQGASDSVAPPVPPATAAGGSVGSAGSG